MPRNFAEEATMSRTEQEDARKLRVVKRIVKIAIAVVVVGIFLIFGWPITTVDSGHVGVVKRLSAVQETILPEGMNFIRPFTDSVIEMSVQKQLYEVAADAASKDMQDVHSKIAVNFHVIPSRAWWVYQNLRQEYDIRVVAPAVQESVKAATAQYAADDLIRHRDMVKDKIKTSLAAKMLDNGLQIDEVSIVNFDFGPAFKKAIEDKMVMAQETLTSTNKLEKIKVEAEQQIATARAEAETLRLKSQQVTPMMIELEAIKKWDGVMPQFIGGGAVPFIDFSKMQKAK